MTTTIARHADTTAPVTELRVADIDPQIEELGESELIELAIAIVDAGVITRRAQTMLSRIDKALRVIERTEAE